MVTRLYSVNAEIVLEPRWHLDPPQISVGFGHEQIYQGSLKQCQTFNITRELGAGSLSLYVDFINKNNHDYDPKTGRDKAVIIKQVRMNNIGSNQFLWKSKYYPRYPQPWFQEQCSQGQVPAEFLTGITYLGWNGRWQLDFDVPVFTWIHHIENLGWVYD